MRKNSWTDRWSEKATKAGLRSRSAYKLEHILAKYPIIDKDAKVLDLGSAPGGWSQIGMRYVGPGGLWVSVDLNEMKPIKMNSWVFVQGDCTEKETREKIYSHAPFDVLLSDMSPSTTGCRREDAEDSLDLALSVLEFIPYMQDKRSCIVKILQGFDISEIVRPFKSHFSFVKAYRPTATRLRSREIYIIASSGGLIRQDKM